jgi:uncharacterized protein (DUF433 family)
MNLYFKISYPFAFTYLRYMNDLLSRITSEPDKCGGKPCIRGMRIRVVDVLELLAAGMTQQQVLDEHPDIQDDDIRACLLFAARRTNYPFLNAA